MTAAGKVAHQVPHLFRPLKIGPITLRNRIVVSPMCQYSAVDGFVNQWHLVHLGSRAVGGAGLVLTEATAVSPEGRITPYCAGIWSDEQARAWRPIVRFIWEQGAVPGIQLAHSGRKGSTKRPWEGDGAVESNGWQPISFSDIPFSTNYPKPRKMTAEDRSAIVKDFSAAAKRAAIIGFGLIEIHAAHGYLLHHSYSPIDNPDPSDDLLLEVVDAVKQRFHGPIFVRLSCSDWNGKSGVTIESSIKRAAKLAYRGVDVIDCSSGGMMPHLPQLPRPAREGYQVPFSTQIRSNVNVHTGAVGMLHDPEYCEAILEDKKADLVFLAREMLRNPYWPVKAAEVLHHSLPDIPSQYVRAYPATSV